MSITIKNGFYFTNAPLNKEGFVTTAKKCNIVTEKADLYQENDDIKVFSYITKGGIKGKRICLSSLLLDDKVLYECIEFVLSNKCEFMVRACEDLYETGLIESRYKLSPIMLLHKMGLLENATVVGANHIDRDDIDLMSQCNAKIVFLPSYSMGKGWGIPPVAFAKGKVEISLGTADNLYNKSGDILREARLVRLISNAERHDENSLSYQELLSFCGSGNLEEFIEKLND